MKKAKRLLSFFLTTVLMFGICSGITVGAANVDINKMAVYLKGDFNGRNSAIVKGDLYTSGGNVKFDNSKDNSVAGSIYINSSATFEQPKSKYDLYDKVVKLETVDFNEGVNEFIDFPTISNTVDSYVADWWPLPETLTKDTHFKSLTIKNYLKVDVSGGDKYIVVDSLKMEGSGYIELIGSGNLFLFVKQGLALSASNKINGGGNPNRVSIFHEGNLSLGGSAEVFANVYSYTDSLKIDGGGTLTGNIVSAAKNLEITGGARVNGVVYTPYATAKVYSDTNAIHGRLVADNLELYGSGTITYDGNYSALNISPAAFKYVVTVDVSPAGAGTVTPGTAKATYEEVLKISASANSGYKFLGLFYDDGLAVQSTDGNVKIVDNTRIVAKFEKDEPVIEEPSEPMLINFPYAYLYGYEDGTSGAMDNIKREEAAALLYRLLKQDNKTGGFSSSSVQPFTNIESNRWSRAALEYMKYIGVYTTDYISPRVPIIRGEVAKLVSSALNINPDASKTMTYEDISADNPYYTYIKALSDIGVLKGYDNKVEPDKNMTRAEFIVMINRLIGRDSKYDISASENLYPDMKDSDWYYEDMMRASFGYSDDAVGGIYHIEPSRKPDRSTIDYN